MVILLKIKRRDFFQRDSIPILVSRTVKTRKFKLLYFRNETSYGNGNLYKDLLFVCLQPSVNKNSYKLAILTFQFDDVTVKIIYSQHTQRGNRIFFDFLFFKNSNVSVLQFIDFKARSRYKFLRFLSGLVSLPAQCHE